MRVLDNSDKDRLLALCAKSPLTDLFVASRVASYGVEQHQLGCPIYGFERDGELVAACHAGVNLVPIGDDDEAIECFVEALGPRRYTASIMGPAEPVLKLHAGLTKRWGTSWGRSREVRANQPLLVADKPSPIAVDNRVRAVEPRQLASYFKAAVAMYTEEVGLSPLDPSDSYRRYIATLVRTGCSFGACHLGHFWFKSDVGVSWGPYCQIQGVWLEPKLRGHGLSEPAMAKVLNLCLERWRYVSLYVNDFNIRARKLYEKLGFEQVGQMATVLY